MRHLFFCALLLALLPGTSQGQDDNFFWGFKAGLNYSTLNGPTEQDDAGNTVETFKYNNGFHVGAVFGWRFTDNLGIRSELLYSQKGTRQVLDGQSYRIFRANSGNLVYTTGNAKYTLRINNGYLDLPIMGYVKLGSKFELSAGVNAAVLVASTGSGELSYSGKTETGLPVNPPLYTLEYNFIGNDAGTAIGIESSTLNIGNETVQVPKKLGAYYDYDKKDGNYFNAFDFGLVGGLSFLFNQSLSLGVRANYGLTDTTNNKYDFSRVKSNKLQRIARSDTDRNLSLQFSIGLSF